MSQRIIYTADGSGMVPKSFGSFFYMYDRRCLGNDYLGFIHPTGYFCVTKTVESSGILKKSNKEIDSNIKEVTGINKKYKTSCLEFYEDDTLSEAMYKFFVKNIDNLKWLSNRCPVEDWLQCNPDLQAVLNNATLGGWKKIDYAGRKNTESEWYEPRNADRSVGFIRFLFDLTDKAIDRKTEDVF